MENPMKRPPKPMLLALALLVAFIAGYAWLAAAGPTQKAQRELPPPSREPDVLRYAAGAPQLTALKVEPVFLLPVPLAEPLNARLAYDDNVTVRLAVPIAGRVTALLAQAGDRVKKGAVLLRLDAPEFGVARADADKAAADEQRKRLALGRARVLFDGEVLARKDLEAAEADYQAARAEAERARLRLAGLGASGTAAGQTFELRSPIAGLVADRQANPGMELRPDLPNPLFIVTDLRRLWAMVDLPEQLLGKVAVGRKVAVEVDAFPGERFPAVVERVAPVLDPATRRIQVRVALANDSERLRPEMYARVTLQAEGTPAVQVANAALVTEGLATFVFVERAPGEFQKRAVTLLWQDREHGYLSAGLQPGERVVSAGALLLNAELTGGN